MSRPFLGARIEDSINASLAKVVRRFGWQERLQPYISYGSPHFVRVLGRVLLSPDPDRRPLKVPDPLQALTRRGFRNFILTAAGQVPVSVWINGTRWDGVSSRGGYIDIRLDQHGLTPGWHELVIQTGNTDPVAAPLLIIDPEAPYGLISDIDDTVISTSLPRPLIAAWNSFILQEHARTEVAGMMEFYQYLHDRFSEIPTIYLSTGAWNASPTIRRFLDRHHYPVGPLIMTDWGPTNTGWFRSGRLHKFMNLRHLIEDFPQTKWILVGDDGQHDPAIYQQIAAESPQNVAAIAIRQLSVGEQVLAHGTFEPINSGSAAPVDGVPIIYGPDGHQLQQKFAALPLR